MTVEERVPVSHKISIATDEHGKISQSLVSRCLVAVVQSSLIENMVADFVGQNQPHSFWVIGEVC